MNDATVPYMAALEISVLGGIPARLFRISFSGDMPMSWLSLPTMATWSRGR